MNSNKELTIGDFGVLMADGAKDILGEGYSIEYKEILKNNGVAYHALIIRKGLENVSPTIYIDSFYEDYRKGEDIRLIPQSLVKLYRMSCRHNIDVDFFMDFSTVCEHLTFRLVNAAKNEAMLRDIPYREFEDLALLPICSVKNKSFGSGNIVITKRHLEFWEISEDELWENVFERAKEVSGVKIENLSKFMTDRTGIPMDEYDCNMYVVTNSTGLNGASSVLFPEVLKKIAEKVGSDLILIPSSVHEMIAIPYMNGIMLPWGLPAMIREVNETVLADEEILSNNAYYYDAKEDKLSILEGNESE